MASHLVQLLLPIANNEGRSFPKAILEKVKDTLVEKFGGVTAFERAPARGVWAPSSTEKQHDELVTIEVMVDEVDERWWAEFRQALERDLSQQEIVVRAFPICTL